MHEYFAISVHFVVFYTVFNQKPWHFATFSRKIIRLSDNLGEVMITQRFHHFITRISLNPGETKRICIKFYTDQFGYYSHRGNRQWNIAPGTYELKIGASSQDIRLKQQIVLTGDKVVKPLRDHYFSEVIR
jgi:hypothetical protein